MNETTQSDMAIQKVPTTSVQRQPETFAPRNLVDAIKFAELVSKSGMCPKEYAGKPEAIVVAIQMGMEVGLQPLQALQSIAVINGKPALYGDAALALVKTHPEFEWVREDDLDTIRKNNAAKCIIKRRNQPEVVMTFTMEDAKKAGLQGKTGPWSTYPNRMLQMRARGFAIRDAFPDALKGIITAEEAQDMPPIVGEGGVNYDQSPPAESKPDPNEEPISKVEATELWRTATGNGHTVETYKAGVVKIAGVDRSDHIRRKFLTAITEYVSKAPAAPEAPENMDAEPVEQSETGQQG